MSIKIFLYMFQNNYENFSLMLNLVNREISLFRREPIIMTKPCLYFWCFSLVVNIIGLILSIVGLDVANTVLTVGYIGALLLMKIVMDGKLSKFI